ncbi:hypothetical protein CW304_02205 [Bacillus sp. UFRGS-B20]|nr:hypothetical protein CW304_02205 [Bacillus sp. UFRGS-B20]
MGRYYYLLNMAYISSIVVIPCYLDESGVPFESKALQQQLVAARCRKLFMAIFYKLPRIAPGRIEMRLLTCCKSGMKV